MNNYFHQLLIKHGIKHEIKGHEIWYSCPLHGHSNNDINMSASYNIVKNKCNCFVHGGDIVGLISYLEKIERYKVSDFISRIDPKYDSLKTDILFNELFETKDSLDIHDLKKYSSKVHKSYTFENFTSNIELIKKLEIGYDENSRRITIPVKDKFGNVAFVVKRSVDRHSKLRYIYEPKGCEKSAYLYGMNFWKNPKYLIVVEGVKDVIKCMDKGIKNVVAILGSKPSFKQIELLKELTGGRLYIALDNDDAGKIGNEMFKKYCFDFDDIYFFKHPKKDGRDIAEYTYKEIKSGIKNADLFKAWEEKIYD